MLEKHNMMSINQLNAQIKISEVWKAINNGSYPLKIKAVSHEEIQCATRAVSKGALVEFGKTEILQSTFLSDASKAWNRCPESVTTCKSLWSAKKSY